MKFALKLKELREYYHLTQRDLAEALNLSKGSIGMWESTDRVPNANTLKKIAQFFDVSMDELIDEKGIYPPLPTQDNNFTQEECNLINSYRELNQGGKHLINETMKTLLATSGGSEQEKNRH